MAENLKDKRLLVIVESPNKCKHIQEYLHDAGYKKAIVMASVGHISEIKTGGKLYNTGIDVANDFAVTYTVSDDKKDIVKKLKEQVEAADVVALMTDPDREGASISWSLVKFLKLKKDKYIRCVTHEITPKAVVYAIEHPIKLEELLIEAADVRRIEDLGIGFGISKDVRRSVGCKSAGRCQSPTMKLIVDREMEIVNFVPEKYIDLYVNFEKNNAKFKAKYIGTDAMPIQHLKSQSDVNMVKLKCTGDYIVKKVDKKEKQESPKPPFCTVTYQQEATSKLGLSTKSAMDIAQNLFHDGKITYMRTDDTEFSPEFVPELKKYILSTYGPKAYVEPRKGKKSETAQEGHECLRVTDPSLTPEDFAAMGTNEFALKVYKLIWQRTIAACLPNTIISETTYNIYNNDQKFSFVSNEVIYEGYRQIYNYKDTDQVESDLVKETFNIDEKLQKTKLEDVAKQTNPPARFSETTLLKELDKRGIGRPSTFQKIIETVLDSGRGYCTVEGKSIVPTDRGIQLVKYLDRCYADIINLEYTSQMEKKLDLVASGELSRHDCLTEFFDKLNTAINRNAGATTAEAKICPKCGAPMAIRRSKFGKLFYGCTNYPKCNGIVNV